MSVSHDQSPLSQPARVKMLVGWGAAFVAACGLIMWAGDSQRHGMIGAPDSLNLTRLWPLVALLIVAFVFIRAFARIETIDVQISQATAWIVRHRRAIYAAGLCVALCGSLLAVWDLRAFPSSGDEYSYLFGAHTFLAGRLWNPAPANPQLFATPHILIFGGKWVSKYEPGWAAVLAAGHWLGLPFWAINPLLGVVLLIIVLKIALRCEGALVGAIALTLIVISPFYIFMTASYFNHVICAVFGASFVYFALAYLEKPGLRPALCAGAALGTLGLVRTFDVFIFAFPFAAAILLGRERRQLALAPLIVLGGSPFVVALLFYNDAITGSPFLPLAKLYAPALRLGLFPVDDWGHAYPAFKTLGQAATLIGNLAEWTSPVILIAHSSAMYWRGRQGKLRFYDWIFYANVAFYMLHPGTGSDRYGPRFYFESYPYFILTIGAAVVDFMRPHTMRRDGIVSAGVISAHLMIAVAGLLVVPYFMRRTVDERMNAYAPIDRNHLDNAVVVLRTGAGMVNGWGPTPRNGIALSGRVIYAWDPGKDLPALKAMFPLRQFFVYEQAAGAAQASLKPLD